MQPLRAARDAHQVGLRRGRPRRRSHVRRRGARLPRGPAGTAVRGRRRQAAGGAAGVHRTDPPAGLHRQRAQVAAAQQPGPATRGDRGVPAVPLAADRAHPPRGSSARWATSPRSCSPATRPASRGCTATRGPCRSPAWTSTCIRSSIRPRRSTRRPCSRRCARTSRACPSCSRTPAGAVRRAGSRAGPGAATRPEAGVSGGVAAPSRARIGPHSPRVGAGTAPAAHRARCRAGRSAGSEQLGLF